MTTPIQQRARELLVEARLGAHDLFGDHCLETTALRAIEAALSSPTTPDRVREAVIRIARDAHAIGWQAGVGGMETAGAIVSYLANHQDQIEPYLADKVSPVDWPDFVNGGCLTWHAQKGGRIVHPSEVRTALSTTEEEG